jgi:hypothetical protein
VTLHLRAPCELTLKVQSVNGVGTDTLSRGPKKTHFVQRLPERCHGRECHAEVRQEKPDERTTTTGHG